MASVPVPPSIIACAKKPRRPTFFNHGGATASAQGANKQNVPPLPPCTFVEDARNRTSELQVWCLWNFLVTACQTWLDVYKSRNNTVKKQPMLDHFELCTCIIHTTAKSYLVGPTRKFTWDQVFSAAGLQNATSPPLHTIDCSSTQYRGLVGGDGDGESRSDEGGGDGGDEGGCYSGGLSGHRLETSGNGPSLDQKRRWPSICAVRTTRRCHFSISACCLSVPARWSG